MRSRGERARSVLTLWVALAILTQAAPAAATKVRIAVSYFANRTGNKALAPLARGLADMLITDLSLADDVVVVERERLNALLAELELQRNPYFDPKTAAKLGRGLGAAYLLTGSYVELRKTLSLEARVVDIEQAKVVLAVRQRGPTSKFFELQRALAKKLLAGIGAKLTLLAQKKVGAKGTRSYEAFKHYARSLAARDAKDKTAEKRALARAIALDPNFVAVKERLEKLSRRVSALEKAGGLIVTPTRADQHLHNSKIHRQAGRRRAARASSVAGLRLDPALIDLWRELRLASPGGGSWPKGVRASARRKALLEAYVAGRAHPLWKTVRDHRAPLPRRALAAALLFDLKDAAPPYASAYDSAMLYQSARILTGPSREAAWRTLELVDVKRERGRVQRRMRSVFPTRWRGIYSGHGFYATINNHSTGRKGDTEWELLLNLQDRPSSLTLRLSRHPRHPHWKERAIDPRYMGFAAAGVWNMPKRLVAAMGDPKRLVYRPKYPPPRRTLMGKTLAMRVTDLGKPIRILDESIRGCKSARLSTTGRCAVVSLLVNKGTLLPGCYQVEIAYRDARGEAVKLRSGPVWAEEFKTTPFWGSRRALYAHLDAGRRAVLTKRYEGLKGVRWPFAHVLNILPVYAERFALMSRRKKKEGYVPYPLASIAYDVDYGLNGGKIPPAGDPSAWIAYRARVRRKGRRVKPPPYRPAPIPLPTLAPGRHSICLVGLHKNGAISPEPECHGFSIPEPPPPR